MAFVSRWSTQENLDALNKALDDLDKAKAEAELAIQAKIPDAEKTLQLVEEAINRITLMKQVYFPSGVSIQPK